MMMTVVVDVWRPPSSGWPVRHVLPQPCPCGRPAVHHGPCSACRCLVHGEHPVLLHSVVWYVRMNFAVYFGSCRSALADAPEYESDL